MIENGVPQTIEELETWYLLNNLPEEEVSRFFIGRNYEKTKAFGIYKDITTDKFIVYKNKADGTRAIRYEGYDEEYAVKEFYDRLQKEIINQKAQNNYENGSNYNQYNTSTYGESIKKPQFINFFFYICIYMDSNYSFSYIYEY